MRLCVVPQHPRRDEVDELLWRDRFQLLREIACHSPCAILRQELWHRKGQAKPPRVSKSDLFGSDASSDAESEGGMMDMFSGRV